MTESAPTEFVVQVLEPTGGKISRPKDWFYSEGHRGPVYEWLITREAVSAYSSYTTGVRIQVFPDVQKGTGKTAKQFILDAATAAKQRSLGKILNSFPEINQGLFTRIGLETEEGTHHILYSLFWGSSGLDVAVVFMAGTTNDLWPVYVSTFNKMNDFELLEMKRFRS
jgi:hypothetical protein